MDQVEILVSSVLARRALLVEEFLRQHTEHWPGPQAYLYQHDAFKIDVKCSCGAQLEVVVLIKLVVNNHTVTVKSSVTNGN